MRGKLQDIENFLSPEFTPTTRSYFNSSMLPPVPILGFVENPKGIKIFFSKGIVVLRIDISNKDIWKIEYYDSSYETKLARLAIELESKFKIKTTLSLKQ